MNQVSPKPLWRRVLRRIILAAVLLLILAAAVLSVWDFRVSRRLQSEMARIRAAREPVTFQDLKTRLPKVDEAVNAARFYQAGMDLITRSAETGDLTVEYGHCSTQGPAARPGKKLLAQSRSVLADNQLALAMFDNATNLPVCRNDLWIENGIGAILPRLSRPRQAARLLSLRTCCLTLEGKSDAAVDSAVTSLRMTRLLDDQPLLIAYLVKIACQTLAFRDAQFVLQFGAPSEKALARLQNALLEVDQPREVHDMILGERVYQIETMRTLIAGASDLTPVQAPENLMPERWPQTYRLSPWLKQMALDTLRDSDAVLVAVRNAWPAAFNDLKNARPIGVFGQILTPAYQHVLVQVGRKMAAGRCTAVAVMIERYRRAHRERLPQTLADLVPAYAAALPLDPFTGKPLLYRRDKNDYTVYSVNDDQVDNGGMVDPRPATQPTQSDRSSPGKQLAGLNPSARCTTAVSGRTVCPDWGIRIRLK
jgi:hypothetical protein